VVIGHFSLGVYG